MTRPALELEPETLRAILRARELEEQAVRAVDLARAHTARIVAEAARNGAPVAAIARTIGGSRETVYRMIGRGDSVR